MGCAKKKRTIKSPKKSGKVKKSAIRKVVKKAPPKRKKKPSRVEAYSFGEAKSSKDWPYSTGSLGR